MKNTDQERIERFIVEDQARLLIEVKERSKKKEEEEEG